MKILSLTAENVKRLKAVHIEPDGALQVVTGRNAQGKSSVLDAIWLALGGGTAMRDTARPMRDGEDNASVTLDLGDLIVTRKWNGTRTTLTVTNAEGAKFSSPQKMLDDLIGRMGFDPLAFTRLSAREQVAALLDLVNLDIDLDAIAAERQRLYDERAETGRKVKGFGDLPAVDESLPAEEQSAGGLINQIQEADVRNRQIEQQREEAEGLSHEISRLEARLSEARARVADIETFLSSQEGAPIDIDSLRYALADIGDTNAAIRANNEARAQAARKAELAGRYSDITQQIEALDSKRSNALAKAEFPVEGLGFDDDGVTYNGIPFSQASSAEQIKVSLAMAMALNPKLRVIRIMDGSLLDSDAMTEIARMAADSDYQVWVERVADGSNVGVVIEDGEVA